MLTNLRRAFNFALTDIWRNKGISIAAIFVLIITIMLVTGFFFLHGASSFLISEIQNRIDITAYFKDGTSENDILNLKDQILKADPDIKSIQYVSKDDALADFNAKHQDNPVFAKALKEVGDNPFLPSLNITTNGDPNQYAKVADILQGDQFSKFLEKVDFSQKRDTIEKVFSITSSIDRFGIGLGLVFVLMAVLVVFNTIKLAIRNSKEEINTMKIVGATGWFIKLPFIVQGAVFGLVSFVFCFALSFAAAYFASSSLSMMMPGFNIFNYFMVNIWIVVLLQLVFGIGLGMISSFIVVRKYLNV